MEVTSAQSPALELKQLNPKSYLETFLNEKVRPDGREMVECRQTSINAGA